VINCLATLPTGPPIIAIDCEGKDVGRYGTLAVIQLHDFRNNHTFIIDVVILGHATFYTCATNSTMTLRDIFELPLIRKIMWDFRNDQDAIFAGFAVELDGIDDAQILELATRCACDREK
jgi:exonuclease 3'-5' domain-containing protein 1